MSARARTWGRILLAGPGAVIVALVTMAGMTRWLPTGTAGIDHVVLPLVFAPLIWAALFFYACLDPKLTRVGLVAGALLLVHGALVGAAFTDAKSAKTETAR